MKKTVILILMLAVLITALTACSPSVYKDVLDSLPSTQDKVDVKEVANNIAPTAVKAGVKVVATLYSFSAQTNSQITSQGSGVIFYETETEYFILTNNHVVTGEKGYYLSLCNVYSSHGGRYSATVIAKSTVYDLAIIRIEKGDTALAVSPLAKANPKANDFAFSVGNPDGLCNLVTYGYVLTYTDLEDDGLAISVIAHDALTDNGSSGGGLYNKDGQLVGINYAGGEAETADGETEAKYSFAIPVESVLEFLAENGYTFE